MAALCACDQVSEEFTSSDCKDDCLIVLVAVSGVHNLMICNGELHVQDSSHDEVRGCEDCPGYAPLPKMSPILAPWHQGDWCVKQPMTDLKKDIDFTKHHPANWFDLECNPEEDYKI